jgi:hypothetical protein
MKGYSLGRKVITLVIPTLLLLAPVSVKAAVHNHNLVPFLRDVRGPMCSTADPALGAITANTPLNALLFNRTGCGPVLAPDGHQLTLREFTGVQGNASVRCISMGTRSVLHFSGLVPNQVYTVWLFLVNPNPPFDYLGAGSLGRTDPTENFFTADADGEGQISRTTPAQMLSAFGNVGPCFLDDVVEIHLVYHTDEMTHGRLPGDSNVWVVNARFFFPDFSRRRGEEDDDD